jgi:hypothetical protein
MFSQGAGLRAQPGIESRLPTAGLCSREFNSNAGAVQYMHNRLADLRKECVDQTSNEKLDRNRLGHFMKILSMDLYLPLSGRLFQQELKCVQNSKNCWTNA